MNILLTKRQKIWIAILVTIVLVGFLTLRKSFELTLFGDDWLQLWILKYQFGEGRTYSYYSPSSYLGPYSAQFLMMGILSGLFGYNPLAYFVASFVLRVGAALTLLLLTWTITKSYTSAFITGLFFAVTTAGLDTTNWTLKMNGYVSIFFLALAFVFFLRARKLYTWKNLTAAVVSFLLAIAFEPQRTHGAFPIFLGADFLWVLQKRRLSVLKMVVIRQGVLILGIILLASYRVFGAGQEWFLQERLARVEGQEFTFLLTLITSFGNIIIPDNFWQISAVKAFLEYSFRYDLPHPSLLVPLLGFIAFSLPFAALARNRHFFFTIVGVLGGAWTFVVWLVSTNSTSIYHRTDILGPTLFGGYILVLILAISTGLYLDRKYELASNLVLFSVWPIVFTLIPWTFNLFQVLNTAHRYQIVPAAGVAVLFGLIFTLVRNNRYRLFLGLLLTAVFLLHFLATNTYLHSLAEARGIERSDRIWQKFLKEVPQLSKEDFSVFYFEGDGTNGDILYNLFLFGFPPKLGIFYDIDDPNKVPIAIDNFEDFSNAVGGGDFLRVHGREPEIISPERIYAFRLVGKDQLINIKDEVMGRLEKKGYGYK